MTNFVLQKVLYSPHLQDTLFSISAATLNGLNVLFTHNGNVLLTEKNGTVIAKGFRRNRLFYLDAVSRIREPSTAYNDRGLAVRRYEEEAGAHTTRGTDI